MQTGGALHGPWRKEPLVETDALDMWLAEGSDQQCGHQHLRWVCFQGWYRTLEGGEHKFLTVEFVDQSGDQLATKFSMTKCSPLFVVGTSVDKMNDEI